MPEGFGQALFGDGNLFFRGIGNQLLGYQHCTAVATQQQAVAFKGGQVLTDRNFRGFETLGQFIHADFALFIEQGQDVVASLGRISFRHFGFKFRFER